MDILIKENQERLLKEFQTCTNVLKNYEKNPLLLFTDLYYNNSCYNMIFNSHNNNLHKLQNAFYSFIMKMSEFQDFELKYSQSYYPAPLKIYYKNILIATFDIVKKTYWINFYETKDKINQQFVTETNYLEIKEKEYSPENIKNLEKVKAMLETEIDTFKKKKECIQLIFLIQMKKEIKGFSVFYHAIRLQKPWYKKALIQAENKLSNQIISQENSTMTSKKRLEELKNMINTINDNELFFEESAKIFEKFFKNKVNYQEENIIY